MTFKPGKTQKFKKIALSLVSCLLALILLACGNEEPTARPVVPNAPLLEPTATPPFPAKIDTPTLAPLFEPTARGGAGLFSTPSPTAIKPTDVPPTNTPNPNANFTATAGLPPLNLTPGTSLNANATGWLAYLQAGNLWLSDTLGGDRRQLTDGGDIPSNSYMNWNTPLDKVAFYSADATLWVVNLQGKRQQIFSLTRQNRPGSVALPPLPTLPPQPDSGQRTSNLPVNLYRAGAQITEPVWSPDGRYLAWCFFVGEASPLASGEIWLADTTGDKAIVNKIADGLSPGWSGDSKNLAYLSRGETKIGAARPAPAPGITPTAIPPRPSLAPPVNQRTPVPATPRPSQPAAAPVENMGFTSDDPVAQAQTTVQPTPTPIFVRPGNQRSPTPSLPPTATKNIQVFPSPTPPPTFPPVYFGTYIVNRIFVYSLISRRANLLLESDKLPEAFIDISDTPRSYIPAPLQNIWYSTDGRFIAFADGLSVIGVMPTAPSSTPVIWTGEPQGYAAYEVVWLPRSDGLFVRFGDPYSDEFSRVMLLTFPGRAEATGISGDVTNRALLKTDLLSGTKARCLSLSPGGNLFSYNDGAALVVVRSNGTALSAYPEAECGSWSPLGNNITYARKDGERPVVLVEIERRQVKVLLTPRGVDKVFWLNLNGVGSQPQPEIPPTSRP